MSQEHPNIEYKKHTNSHGASFGLIITNWELYHKFMWSFAWVNALCGFQPAGTLCQNEGDRPQPDPTQIQIQVNLELLNNTVLKQI